MRSTPSQTSCRVSFGLLLGSLLLSSICCVGRYYLHSYPGHSTFTAENLDRINVGMSPEDIRAILGIPDVSYDAEFGADLGEPWRGEVWLYFIEADERLESAERFRKGLFVFYPPGEGMRLNHWSIEGQVVEE